MSLQALLSLVLFFGSQDADIENLKHMDAKVRESAARIIGKKKNARAIPHLIDGLEDKAQAVRTACHEGLVTITGEDMHPEDIAGWRAWWDNVGRQRFPVAGTDAAGVRSELARLKAEIKEDLRQQQEDLKEQMRQLREDTDSARDTVTTVSIVVIALSFLFVLIMFYFVGHVSSRIKEWKDLMRSADTYIQEAKQITERVDGITDEVDKKKAEIYELFGKMKDDAQEEVGRYADLLQQNSDHRLREELMELRQKAERELEGTLGEIKTAMGHEMRRLVDGQTERFEKAAKGREERFMNEVESHRIFLEAAFYSSNGRLDEAARAYHKLLELNPKNSLAWVNLGRVYMESGKLEEAQSAYQKALDISPSDARACYSMASIFARLKNKEKMLEYLRQASVHDGEFKDDALNDPAFREYWHDAEFKDIAEA